MASAKLSLGRQHTGTFGGDRMQAQARAASLRVNSVDTRVAALERLAPVSMMLASNFTTTSATAQNTTLRFPVEKGDLLDLEFWGYASCSSVNGMAYAISCPAGSVLSGELETSSTNTAVTNWSTQSLTASTLSTACHAGANNNGRPDRINARVKVAADGFITLQVASITGATTTTLYAKSYLRAMRVVEV